MYPIPVSLVRTLFGPAYADWRKEHPTRKDGGRGIEQGIVACALIQQRCRPCPTFPTRSRVRSGAEMYEGAGCAPPPRRTAALG